MTIQAQIRSTIKVLLVQALPAVHVLMAPRYQLGKTHLPALAIFGHEDRPLEADADTQQLHQRVYTVRVEVRVEDSPEDDCTDPLAKAIRRALLTQDLALWPLVDQISWTSQMWTGDEGEDPMSGTALDFEFVYQFDPSEEA